jgi:transcriptional regulator with XRE-family HTH domain
MNFFIQNIKYLRKKRGLKQDEMLDSIGFARTTYASYEAGTSQPNIDGILRIADYYGVDVTELLQRDLSNVQVIEKTEIPKNRKNVQLNVQADVQLKQNNVLTEPLVNYGMPRFITVDSQGEENCLYVPVKARAGYLSGLTDPSFIETLPTYRLPGLNNGSYRIFEVDGHSMFPTFHDKDKAICRAEMVDKIRDDRTYVLITKNDGILCKRLINRASQGVIICKSDNNHKGEYPPIVLDVSEILEVWYVTDKWTKQLPSPGEIYKRIIDLEADVIMMKQKLLKQQ